MPNTSDRPVWLQQQEALIASLAAQPILVVVRPDPTDLDGDDGPGSLLDHLSCLASVGLRHVEIGWLGYALWAIYLPFMYCGSWMLPHSGIGPHSLSTLVVNVEYVSERFGLLVIITCGESLFAAVAILQQSDSVKKMLVACLSVYYALLIKLLYFELQSCVAKHAINVNALRSIMWTLAHLPLYISAAGAGAVLHWAATGHKWLVRERNLFLGFTCVLLLSLSIIALFHGKLHNDRGVWWTKKRKRLLIQTQR